MTFEHTIYKDMDLRSAGYMYPLFLDKCPEELLQEIGMDDTECDGYCIWITEETRLQHDFPIEAIDWDWCIFEDELAKETYLDLINAYPHYLVFANGCRWDGASGYKFADSFSDALRRDYASTIYPRIASKRKKTLVATEYSHDVPMGATTVFVGLTEAEYRSLRNKSFEDIEEFVEKHMPKEN